VHAEERAHAMLSRETECKREQGREGRRKGAREIALEMLEMNRKKHAGVIGKCVLPQHYWRGQALSRWAIVSLSCPALVVAKRGREQGNISEREQARKKNRQRRTDRE